jgi:hypothetical protein
MKTEKKRGGAKAPRKHDPKWKDTTRTARSDKRKAELQAAAELNGFETWSGMMTYIKNKALEGQAVVMQ